LGGFRFVIILESILHRVTPTESSAQHLTAIGEDSLEVRRGPATGDKEIERRRRNGRDRARAFHRRALKTVLENPLAIWAANLFVDDSEPRWFPLGYLLLRQRIGKIPRRRACNRSEYPRACRIGAGVIVEKFSQGA
jgi:hypothetical protein